MRYILIILVFLSAGANAQMVIKAHANYRPYAQPASNLLLDDYPNAAAAYSLRKLDKDYTGAAIRVRKDTTGQPEQDIGFTASGDLDTAALKSFLNARSGFITTWYSQGDSTNVNFSQSTQANQPRIALNGVIDRLDGKPTILFDNFGGADFLTVASSTQKFAFLHQSGLSSVVFVGATGGTSDTRVIIDNYGTSSANIGYSMYQEPGAAMTTAVARGVGGTFVSAVTTSNNFIKVKRLAIYYNELDNANGTAASRNKLYLNSDNPIANNTFTNAASSSNASFNMRIGVLANNTSLLGFSGYMNEIIFYKGDKTSSRTGITNNINDYYNIYWNGDFTGILDTYPNSAAAYSLRNLSSTYTGPLIRVRKDTTGQPEMDIYGDYYGNLDTVGLKNFAQTRSCFVTTWYSQGDSTGMNLLSETSSQQPRIVNAGTIERSNGKIAMSYYNSGQRMYMKTVTQKLAFLHQTGLSSVVSVMASTDLNNLRWIFDNFDGFTTQTGYTMYQDSTGKLGVQVGRGASLTYTSNNLTANNFLQQNTLQIIYNELDNNNATASNRNKLYANGGNAVANSTNTSAPSSSNATNDFQISGRSGAGTQDFRWNGFMSEFIIYKGDKTSSRTGIRDNINTYWSIY